MDEAQIREALDFALNAVREAGAITLRYFQSDTGYEMKSDNTPVTKADREAEEFLRESIEKHYPTHGIVGEEYGIKAGTDPGRWIIDPIDGTFSFICRVPMYCNLIGLEWEGEMVAGVIHMPALSETVYAGRGMGCRWDTERFREQPARVSDVRELSRARLLHGGPKLMQRFGKSAAFERLRENVYAERGWCDGYAYALVATGRAEIMLDPILSIWDTAALMPVITEAGGTLTDWSGTRTHTAPEAVATNGHLFEATMTKLNDR